MLVHHYSHPTTPAGTGTDTVISNAVQVQAGHKFTARAALGDAGVIGIDVDDDAAAYDFKGLWRWYVIEDGLPSGDHYAYNGYVGVQEMSRGNEGDTVIPVSTGRRWNLELQELSGLAGFRAISGDDGNRAAETISARLTWLLGTVYLPVYDNGLVVYDTTALDANDFRGQFAGDVLRDMANIIGFNWWIYYDQTAGQDSLAFFDPESTLYSSTISISNAGDADGSTVFAASEDTKLRRDPQKIAAGVYLPYTGGAVYEYDYATSYTFAFRDQVAPTASVKTAAKATALADRFLADNNGQDIRITTTIRMPAAQLNDIKHGQRVPVKLQHTTGTSSDFSSYRWCRVVSKTFAPPANRTQAFFDVDLELSPQAAPPSGAFAKQQTGVGYSGQPTLPHVTTPGRLLFALLMGQGDVNHPSDFRFKDDPRVSPASPEVPPFADHAGWTLIATARTDYSGQNIGGPCGIPYHAGGGACTSSMLVGAAYRFVQPGEVTTTPVAVSTDLSNASTSVWLWELDTAVAPSGVNVTGDGFAVTAAWTASLATIAGNAVAFFAHATSAGHPAINNPIAESNAGAGSFLFSCTAGDNNPTLPRANVDTWVQCVAMPTGGIATVSTTPGGTPGDYNHLNWSGIAVVLPANIVLPAIPYPANSVG